MMFKDDKIYENLIEGFFVMSLDRFQIIQEADLEYYAKVQRTFTPDSPCNIYFILRRSRVTVDAKNVEVKDCKSSA